MNKLNRSELVQLANDLMEIVKRLTNKKSGRGRTTALKILKSVDVLDVFLHSTRRREPGSFLPDGWYWLVVGGDKRVMCVKDGQSVEAEPIPSDARIYGPIIEPMVRRCVDATE